MSELYFYRPLAAYNGRVFKCAGTCNAISIEVANELWIKKSDDPVYLPGVAVIDGYKGDKITINRNNVSTQFFYGDPLPVDNNIVEVEVRSVYGNDMIYPANDVAERFTNLTGKKTLSRTDLANIRAIGFEVKEVASKKLAA